jgi:predicted small secreted protein
MKALLLLITVLSMVSCNTSIGLWRDTKAGYNWSKAKIQNSGSGGQQDYEYGAPVY